MFVGLTHSIHKVEVAQCTNALDSPAGRSVGVGSKAGSAIPKNRIWLIAAGEGVASVIGINPRMVLW